MGSNDPVITYYHVPHRCGHSMYWEPVEIAIFMTGAYLRCPACILNEDPHEAIYKFLEPAATARLNCDSYNPLLGEGKNERFVVMHLKDDSCCPDPLERAWQKHLVN